jgi:hypothetical protein
VPADSDDDYDDPLSVVGSGLSAVAANVTVAAATVSASPLRPQVDADGAPILSQLALLPIVSPRAPSMNGSGPSTLLDPLTGVVKVSGDVNNDIDEDDVLLDRQYAPEDDFVDWNFSVKFFRFIRAPPSRPDSPVPAAVNGTAAATTAAVQGGRRASNTRQVMESSEAESNSSVSQSSVRPAAAGRGGRGGAAPRGKQARGGGGGCRGKRRAAGYSSGESDEDSSVERPSKAKGQLLPLIFFCDLSTPVGC